MTVAALTSSIEYLENGVTVAFAVPFRFNAPEHLLAKRIAADGTVTVLATGTDYSVTGGSTDAGGTLTVVAAAVAGTRLKIQRVTPRAQATDYATADTFPAESHEGALDRAMLIDQEQDVKIDDTVSRALLVPEGELTPALADKGARAGKFLAFGPTGDPLMSSGTGADVGLRSDLADLEGAAAVGTRDGGSVQSELDAIKTITPTGEYAADDLSDLLRPFANGPREALVYNDADSVKLFSRFVTMGGFRFRGHYTKGRAPVFAMPSVKVAEYNTTGCPVFSSVKTETWVAVFAVANNGDATATIRTMPFLRLAAPSGSTANIIKGGENVHDLVTTAAHNWASGNNLAGADCLVISEGTAFSGRLTTITANTSTSVTLATIGSIVAGDYILSAPPGWDHYVYLGSFYFDTAEVRNFYDTGTLVKAKMIYLTTPDVSAGSEPSPGQVMNCRGYISPLATGVVMDSSGGLSTGSAGDYAEYFDPDGAAHIVDTRYLVKNSASSQGFVFSNIQVPFLYHQRFNYYNAGSLANSLVGGQINITGWFEP